ncbi:MAG TPA: iron-containing redox enzyme family protein [Kofleriaceae bacterium]|nr:iron-containing redox enzyme family protein [Kofleriaceae bacterium]
MSTHDTIERCQQIIRDKRNARHPFFRDLARPLPTSALRAWAEQKYHQVYLQNPIFGILHGKTQFLDVRSWMVEQLIAEETALTCGSDSHFNLMRRFAEACGAAPAAFAPEAAHREVKTYVDVLLTTMRDEHFVLGLLAIYAIEAQSGESVGKLMAWLRQHYRFSDAQLEWFAVHAADDDDHASTGLGLVTKYAHLVDDFATSAPRVVGAVCDAWLVLHDHYNRLLSEA